MARSTELREAIEKGDLARAAESLGRGASLTLDDHGLTALHHAVRLDKVEMAKLLLENGADRYILLDTNWSHVQSPLFEAVKRRSAEMVTLLVKYAARRIERDPEPPGTAASLSRGGRLNLARQDAFAAHAKLQEQLDGALLNASRAGQAEIVGVLLANGADTNAYPWGGDRRRRPLLAAAGAGFDEVVAVLLRGGAHVNDLEDDQSALYRAVASDRASVVEMLIAAGAQVRLADEAGMTPLHIAASKGFEHIAELLLRAGADPNAANALEETPRYLARGGSAVDRVLRGRGGKIRPYWKGRLRRVWLGPATRGEDLRGTGTAS